MTGYTVTKRNRYKCEYCDHYKSYKTLGGITLHLESRHAAELAKTLAAELAEAQNELLNIKLNPPKPKVIERERVVYRDPPAKKEPEYWYPSGLYCVTCKVVMTRAGIPRGQTIDNTPHSVCGTKSLMLVTEVQ